jgi:phage terminase large subunit-like protein
MKKSQSTPLKIKPLVKPKLNAEVLRGMPQHVVQAVLAKLSPAKVDELKHDWGFWGRPTQFPPQDNNWNTWLINAGRGFGKTRCGAEWVRQQVKDGHMRIACVAATNSDIERVMVKGESGFLNVCWSGDKNKKGRHLGFPTWSPTKRSLVWDQGYYKDKKNKPTVEFYSAEEPERLRGPQFSAAWGDEVAAWNKDIDTWQMLQFCLRLGKHPRVCVTTTPKPTKLMRQLLKNPKTTVTRGSTFDNAANLADTFLTAVKEEYEGTRIGRQELYAEMLEEAEGALWSTATLDKASIKHEDLPELARIVVALDPAVTANAESDMTGIVVAGIDINGISYVLGDYTDKLSPERWAAKAVELYHYYKADRIVAEVNQGGDLVKLTVSGEDPKVPYKAVRASRGKYARAEPVSALYERGLVKHVSNPPDGFNLNELETQMRTWEPLGRIGSPDRLDAMVWAITDLALGGYHKPKLTLAYSSAKGLSK